MILGTIMGVLLLPGNFLLVLGVCVCVCVCVCGEYVCGLHVLDHDESLLHGGNKLASFMPPERTPAGSYFPCFS
jgi:hypothetical protein